MRVTSAIPHNTIIPDRAKQEREQILGDPDCQPISNEKAALHCTLVTGSETGGAELGPMRKWLVSRQNVAILCNEQTSTQHSLGLRS